LKRKNEQLFEVMQKKTKEQQFGLSVEEEKKKYMVD